MGQRDRARHLRRSQTDAEKRLWSKLRGHQLLGLQFRRQQPIGPFIVDFVCFAVALIVELDGGQHGEMAASLRDFERTKWLESRGYRVLRFWNNDVLLNTNGVVQTIELALRRCGVPPTPTLPRKGGGASGGEGAVDA